ncbi:MAG: KEOPS complex kinase/ATPase Bud32 [Nanoarchaeota archaeon]
MEEKILQHGAEAMIILDENKVIKRRIKKSYRLDDIDMEIRKLRTRSEAKLLLKASKVIDVPEMKNMNEESKEIYMEFLEGKKLSEYLDSFSLEDQKKICRIIGGNIAKLHDADIIHGDLTTSNMILKDGKVFFIDFGLGFSSHKIEDKAVDLHLLRQALEAKHFRNWESLFKEVVRGYEESKNHKSVLEQFKKVEKRGRYKKNY